MKFNKLIYMIIGFLIGINIAYVFLRERMLFLEDLSYKYSIVSYRRGCSEAIKDAQKCKKNTEKFKKDQEDILSNFDKALKL